MGTVRGLGGGGSGARGRVVIRPWIPWFETFLLHNSEPEEGRLPQHCDGPGMGDWSQADIIHLETQRHREKKQQSVVQQPNTNIAVHAARGCWHYKKLWDVFCWAEKWDFCPLKLCFNWLCHLTYLTFITYLYFLHQNDQNQNKY